MPRRTLSPGRTMRPNTPSRLYGDPDRSRQPDCPVGFRLLKGARSAERNRPAEPDQAIGVRLAANGYGLVQLGVSDEMARGWARYDGMIFGTVRLVGWAVTAVVVARRRPTKGMAACNIWFASSLYVAPIAVKRIACSNRR